MTNIKSKSITFETREQLNAEIIRRARAILGMRGVRKSNRVQVNMGPTRDRIPLEVTDERLAEVAKRVADETEYYTITYV